MKTQGAAENQLEMGLTREHRPYKKGVFSGVKPLKDFSLGDGTWGAWETTARYTHLDLDDTPNGADPGGELDDFVLGLNWYLNPNTRMMWNYVHSEADDILGDDDEADIFQMRVQMAF